jgi:hypothetical protein
LCTRFCLHEGKGFINPWRERTKQKQNKKVVVESRSHKVTNRVTGLVREKNRKSVAQPIFVKINAQLSQRKKVAQKFALFLLFSKNRLK